MPTTLTAARRATSTACCTPVTGGVLDDEAAETLARVFKALGRPNPGQAALPDRRRRATGGLRLRPDRAGRPVPADRVPPHQAARRRRPHHPRAARQMGLLPRRRKDPRRGQPRAGPDALVNTALSKRPPGGPIELSASVMSPILSEAASIASRHRLPGHTLRGGPCEPTRPRQTARRQLNQTLSRAARPTGPQSFQLAAVPLQPGWTAAHPASNKPAVIQARNPGRAAAGPDRM